MSSNFIYLSLTLVLAVSTDCPAIIALAQGLHMNTTQPLIWSELQNDCCIAATGITCLADRVTQIAWQSKSLDGIILSGLFPNTLTDFDVSSNSLTGNVPVFPSSLENLKLGYNSFSGSIPSPLPSSLKQFIVSQNGFTGSLPAYPVGLTNIDVSNNQFSGNIPSPLPSTVNSAYFVNNQFTGSIPSPVPPGMIL